MLSKKVFLLLFTIVALLLVSCDSTTKASENLKKSVNFEDLMIEDSFDYSTNKNISVDLKVFNGAKSGVSGIPFKIYDKDPEIGGKLLDSGATDDNGIFNSKLIAASYVKTLFVIGYMSSIEIPIINNYAAYEFGSATYNNDRTKDDTINPVKSSLNYLLPYNVDGVPQGMGFEVVPAGFISKINSALPERVSVPINNPHYLYPANEYNAVVINETANVWITFLHEGAGDKNSFGFYTFDVNNPPTTAAEISEINVVFPNVSMMGSGGGLVCGDKIFIGNFEPGTAIGWVLMNNGWYGGAAHLITNTWYSARELNHTGFQQSILFYDDEYERLVVGFEDRKFNIGDDDFNDALFSVTADPVTAIDISQVITMDSPNDADGDGVPDIFDDFPNDPERAFQTNNHSMSTLAFEDLWPQAGDYDFNDLVIDYNIFYHKRADNKIKNIITEFELRAVGARYRNGFAIEFPFSSDQIESISVINGSDEWTYSNIISEPNFAPVMEDGNQATVIYFSNTFHLMQPAGDTFINTQKDVPYITPVKFALDIKFTSPENMDLWRWHAPFNPFITVNQDRSHEVHLPDFPNTPKANLDLFKTEYDTSNTLVKRYYKTLNNLPWALNIADSWDYPYENSKITSAYLKFQEWAETSGTSFADWYKDLPGFRDTDKVYQQ